MSEPVDLDEARQARELAKAMDGKDAKAPGDALEAAVQIASTREPKLSEEARERIGEELLGVAKKARPPWLLAIAAGALAAAGLGIVASMQPTPRADPLRAEAEVLVAQLMPQRTPSDRAQAIADAAAARIAGGAP